MSTPPDVITVSQSMDIKDRLARAAQAQIEAAQEQLADAVRSAAAEIASGDDVYPHPPELQAKVEALIIGFIKQGRGGDPVLLDELEALLNAHGVELDRSEPEEFRDLEDSTSSAPFAVIEE